jgi:tRNA (guanine-N7-)-methyltransferase
MSFRAISNFTDRTDGLNAKVNPFVDKLRNKNTTALPAFHGQELEALRGRYREGLAEHFGRQANDRLIVEIGCHLGKTIRDMGLQYRDADFVGIDMTFKRVVTTADRAQKSGCKNVASVLANAKNLPELFAPGELNGVAIFFPDPWIKKKSQRKNRLINQDFAQGLFTVLAPGAFVWLKSDQQPYVQFAEECFEAAGLVQIETPEGLLSQQYKTTFEHKFNEQNLPTFGSQWFKPRCDQDFFTWENSGTLARQKLMI